jgi:hypothetical protein
MKSRPVFGTGIHILSAALVGASAALHGQTLKTLYSFGHNDLGYKPETGVTIGMARGDV